MKSVRKIRTIKKMNIVTAMLSRINLSIYLVYFNMNTQTVRLKNLQPAGGR